MRQIFAVALKLPKAFFDPYFSEHDSCFRAINYPEPQVTPLPGQLRAGEHTDYGCMTILRVEDAPGGLEVRDRFGRWVLVPAMTGAFVVNIGDMMARWTNDRWVSTLHRVANPPLDRTLGTRRQSLVFFVNPKPNAVIECVPSCTDAVHPPKYPPITAAAHIEAKEQKARG
jgi:isopenicillin N synthase-like dioxygenase